jgi:hypothetical protein
MVAKWTDEGLACEEKSQMGARTSTPDPAILRVWGCTDTDVRCAEVSAQQAYLSSRWEFVEVIPSLGVPCPIPPHDPIALGQITTYDMVWAAYPAEAMR